MPAAVPKLPMSLRDLGRGVVRAMPGLESLARRSYARLPARLQDTPTRRIERFFARDRSVAFVQIGANDGATSTCRIGRSRWLHSTRSRPQAFPRCRNCDDECADAAVRRGRGPPAVRRVDLVVIDVEGAERILIEDIDFDRHGVRFLMFEHKHLAVDDLAAVADRLRGLGFALKPFGRDTIAWRRLPS